VLADILASSLAAALGRTLWGVSTDAVKLLCWSSAFRRHRVGCASDIRLFWMAADHHARREGAMAARKWDSLGTLIAGAVAMVVIVALVIWWGITRVTF
jgi:hypothetical protein